MEPASYNPAGAGFHCIGLRVGNGSSIAGNIIRIAIESNNLVLLCRNMAAAISLNAKTAHPDFSVADLHRPA